MNQSQPSPLRWSLIILVGTPWSILAELKFVSSGRPETHFNFKHEYYR